MTKPERQFSVRQGIIRFGQTVLTAFTDEDQFEIG